MGVKMLKVIPPIIISIGTIGNILTMVVLLRQIKSLSSTVMFLVTLAVSDTVILWCGPFRSWLKVMWEIDIRTLSDVSCKLQIYMTYVSIHLSSLLLVAVTMERVLCVTIPHRIKLLCTPTKASKVIVVITVLVFAFNIIKPISNVLDGSKCKTVKKEYVKFRNDIFQWIHFSVLFAYPFIILLIGNILIIVKLVKSHSYRVKMNATRGKTQSKSEREVRSLTFLLVSLCFVFFVTMSPLTIYMVWIPYRKNEILAMTDPYAQFEAFEYAEFQQTVVNIVAYTNALTNFLLYVFSGSKFREELKASFCCKASSSGSVFDSRHRQSSKHKTQLYNLKSSANISKLSLEHNQSAIKSSAVSDSVRGKLQLYRYKLSSIDVHKNIDGQDRLVDTTNSRHVYFSNTFDGNDSINQVSVTYTGSDVKEQTEVPSEDGAKNITTIANIVTVIDPDNVSMSTLKNIKF